VHSHPDSESLNKQWERLLREFYLDEEFNKTGELQTSHVPNHKKNWVNPSLQMDTIEKHLPLTPV